MNICVVGGEIFQNQKNLKQSPEQNQWWSYTAEMYMSITYVVPLNHPYGSYQRDNDFWNCFTISGYLISGLIKMPFVGGF